MKDNIKFEFRIEDGMILLKIIIYIDNKTKQTIKYKYPLYQEIDIEELLKPLRFVGKCKDNK